LVLTLGAVVNATAATATIKDDFGTLDVGGWELFGAQARGDFSDAWVFSLAGVDVQAATVAINLDFPFPLTIDTVAIVKGAKTNGATEFTFDDPADVLVSASAGQTIVATLRNADAPFAVIVSGSGGPGSYAGTLELAAVPVPAAAWLFGSALVGMVGIGDRRRRQA
jgi:hypothetical protein